VANQLTINHLLDLSRRKLTDRVGDGNVSTAARSLLGSSDLQDTVDVDLEDTLQDSLSGTHGRDRRERELTQRSVVLAVDTFSLEHGELFGAVSFGNVEEKDVELYLYCTLLIRNRSERTLLQARHSLSTRDDGCENVALHSDTKGERDNVQKKKVRSVLRGGLSGKDTGLHSGTISHSLVGVNALLQLLAVEEVAEEPLDTRDTGGTADQDNLVDFSLVDTSILQHLLHREEGTAKRLSVELLETGTGNVGAEVLAIEERVNLDGGLGTVGKRTLGTLASGPETTEGTGITREAFRWSASVAKFWGKNAHSFLVLRLNSFLKCSRRLVSKSWPPKWVSPAVALTVKTPP
jgi:hypothetical protein